MPLECENEMQYDAGKSISHRRIYEQYLEMQKMYSKVQENIAFTSYF